MTTPPKLTRKTLETHGSRGDRVRVLVDMKQDRVEVLHRDRHGVRRKRIFPNTRQGQKDARRWAKEYFDERTRRAVEATAAPLTIAQIWKAYTESPAYTEDIRDATRINYAARWKKWAAFLTDDALVNDTTLHDVDRFRAEAKKAGVPLNQVRQAINVARIVYNWGQSRKLVQSNELAIYRWKQPKDAPEFIPEEYSPDESGRLLAQFDPLRFNQWRPWVMLVFLRESGQRARAIRHLRWQDIDEATGLITWPSEFQKQGKELARPLTPAMRDALAVARRWREQDATKQRNPKRIRGADGKFRHDPDMTSPAFDPPWVLYSKNDPARAYSYNSFHYQLREAEKAAGVGHKPYRAAHGFRKMVVANINEGVKDATGASGLEYVGDRDLKLKRKYDRRELERARKAATHASGAPKPESVPQVSLAPETPTAPTEADAVTATEASTYAE